MTLFAQLCSRQRAVGGCRRLRRLVLPLGLSWLLVSAALAQSPYLPGSGAESSVAVDLSVLDSLGPEPSSAGHRIVLHPPGKQRASPTAPGEQHGVAKGPAERKLAEKAQAAPAVAPAKAPVAAAPGPVAPQAQGAAPSANATAAAASAASGSAAPAQASRPPTSEAPAMPPAASAAPKEPASAAPEKTVAAADPASAKPPAMAALPVAAPSVAAGLVSAVRFTPGLVEIPRDAQPGLDSVAARLAANSALRLQLVAYAGASGDDAIQARRISLARAVAVRAYLIEKGVQSIRMEVRALGNRTDGAGPFDRVDLVILER